MRTIYVTVGPLATASATNVALSQSPGAGAITLNGSTVTNGVATLDVARRVIFVSGGNDSGITFTITGTNWSGQIISETVTGANVGTANTVLSYKTVTSVTHTGSVAGTLTIGTNGVADSPWVRLDEYAFPQVSLQIDVTGTVNVTVQQSLDDPNTQTTTNVNTATPIVTPAGMTWLNHPDANLVAATTSVQGNYAYTPLWVKLVLNSSTQAAGNFATLAVLQAATLNV